MAQGLRGLGDESFQQPPAKVSKTLDTSIIVEIVFFKPNQVWDNKDALVEI